jgi:hypothetical protein
LRLPPAVRVQIRDADSFLVRGLTMINSRVAVSILAALATSLAACDRTATPAASAAADVTQAQAERQEAVTEARTEQAQVQAETAQAAASADPDDRGDAIQDRAEARYNTAMATAKGDQDVALKACESIRTVDQVACRNTAQAKYEEARTQAQVSLDAERKRSARTEKLDN